MSHTSRHNRRVFLKRAAATGLASVAFAGTRASDRVLGANDRIRVAVAGVNGRGTSHLNSYCARKKDVEIAYLVDPDSRLFGPRGKTVQELSGFSPKCVQDIRTALDDKNIDAISTAAPNHWHTLHGIWACQAGKDVYVEKPCSHTIVEGRKLVEAAPRRHERIVQHGTQSRSHSLAIAEIAAVQSGRYGRLLVSYAYAGKYRPSIGVKETKQPPKELDFDLWLGPASQQPYHENLVHYNWHWFWDFGNGEIGNQGVHQTDIARWALPDGAAPKSVLTFGGRFAWNDQGQTPNTLFSVIDCGEAKVILESRDMVAENMMYTHNEFYTDEGVIKGGKFYPRGKLTGEYLPGVAPAEVEIKVDLAGKVIPGTGAPTEDYNQAHFDNFLACMRSRKVADLKAEVLEGHRSSMLCHLANISYRLGQDVSMIQPVEAFGNDIALHEGWASMKQHLVDLAAVKPEAAPCRLGRKLEFDAAAEKFVGDEEANKMLTQSYRKPYELPEQV